MDSKLALTFYILSWYSAVRWELQHSKAELLQEGIFFPHPFICQRRFSNEKVGIRKN